jgi:hypothetical protein
MKRQHGFSLIEVMLAGALMIGLGMAAWQLVTATTKSTGDLEKRQRYHDLVEDLRFLFSTTAQCLAHFPYDSFREEAETRLRLAGDKVVGKDVTLPEYGLKVTRLYFKNLVSYSDVTLPLMSPAGQLLGQYTEQVDTGDLMLEAQLLGSGHALKPVNVVRIALVRRTGALDGETCIGNHDIAGGGGNGGAKGGASLLADRQPLPARTARNESSSAASGSSSAGEAEDGGERDSASTPSKQLAIGRSGRGGAYNAAADCFLHDDQAKRLTGRERIIEGETLKFSRMPGLTTFLRCVHGRIEETSKSEPKP